MGKYCKCSPISQFAVDMAYGSAGGRNWARQTLCLNQIHLQVNHNAGVEGSNCMQPPKQRQASLNACPGKMTVLEISWSHACLGPSGTGPEICLAWQSFLILLKPLSHLFPQDFECVLWQLEVCHCCSASVSLGICWMFWLSQVHFKYTSNFKWWCQ